MRLVTGAAIAVVATAIAVAAPAHAGEAEPADAARRVVEVEPRVVEVPSRVEHLTEGVVDTRTEESDEQVAISVASDVLFAFDSAALTPAAQQLLADVAAQVKEQATGTVTIHGHTDSIGDPAYNQTLSEQRAAAVHEAVAPLVGRDDLAYEVSGFGETQPVTSNENADGTDNPASRERNRRVTIMFQKQSAGDE